MSGDSFNAGRYKLKRRGEEAIALGRTTDSKALVKHCRALLIPESISSNNTHGVVGSKVELAFKYTGVTGEPYGFSPVFHGNEQGQYAPDSYQATITSSIKIWKLSRENKAEAFVKICEAEVKTKPKNGKESEEVETLMKSLHEADEKANEIAKRL
ncbi:hypothetical protein K1719_004023 [Acacia pycnantha]|nr:hypothetical protein K1719_004023 [Acacia pycnantha]